MLDICYLHVGPGKTGTSSIQNSLWYGRDTLAKAGYFYPGVEIERYYFLSSYVSDDPGSILMNHLHGYTRHEAIVEKHTDEYEALVADLQATKCQKMILSDECFSSLSIDELQRLSDLVRSWAKDIWVIFYARPPLEWVVSAIQQDVFLGSQTLDIDETFEVPSYRPALERLSDVFGADKLLLRPFVRESFPNGSLLEDFLQAVDWPIEHAKPVENRANESRSYEAIRICDAYNRQAPIILNGELNDKRSAIPIIARVPGAKFTFEPDVLKMLWQKTEADRQFLTDRYNLNFAEEIGDGISGDRWSQETIDTLVYAFRQTETENFKLRSETLFLKGQLAIANGDAAEAAGYFEQALQVDSGNHDALKAYADLLGKIGYEEEAITVASRHHKKNPGSQAIAFLLQALLIRAGRNAEAKTIKTVRQQEPTFKLMK